MDLKVFLLALIVRAATAEKEELDLIPVQHQKSLQQLEDEAHKVLRDNSIPALAGSKEGEEGIIRKEDLDEHGFVKLQDTDAADESDVADESDLDLPVEEIKYTEDIVLTGGDNLVNLEMKNEALDEVQMAKRMFSSDRNVKHKAWHYDGEKEEQHHSSNKRTKRFLNDLKDAEEVEDSDSWLTGSSHSKRADLSYWDTVNLLNSKAEEAYPKDEQTFETSKRPMGVGPNLSWSNYLNKRSPGSSVNKRPMGMGPSSNWGRYFTEKRNNLKEHLDWLLDMGPTSNFGNYLNTNGYKHEGKRPMGMGPAFSWGKNYINKRPMGMGPSSNWARYFNKRSSENELDEEATNEGVKQEEKRPINMGPNSQYWVRFFDGKRGTDSAHEDSDIAKRPMGNAWYPTWESFNKRPFGFGPELSWAKYFNKRGMPLEDQDDVSATSKRPIGASSRFINWSKVFDGKRSRSGNSNLQMVKKPIGFGPALKWDRIWGGGGSKSSISKRPINMGPTNFGYVWGGFNRAGRSHDMEKRLIGMGPSVNWMKYYKE